MLCRRCSVQSAAAASREHVAHSLPNQSSANGAADLSAHGYLRLVWMPPARLMRKGSASGQ